MAELRSLLKKDEEAKLYAISIDPQDVSKDFAAKIAADGKGTVNFPLLSDPGHKTIDAYGLRDPAYEGQKVFGVPHPAVYVVDKEGRVAWAKVESDFRKRPTNEEIRAALEATKKIEGLKVRQSLPRADGLGEAPGSPPPGKVWSTEHGHWHDMTPSHESSHPEGQPGTPQPPASSRPDEDDPHACAEPSWQRRQELTCTEQSEQPRD